MSEITDPENQEPLPDFPDNLVTIARFFYLYEAEMLAAKLDAEGIEAFIPDAMTISMDPFMANTIGGIRVQVRATDLDNARTVLNVVNSNNTPETGKPEFVVHNGKKMRLNKGVCMECTEPGIYITVQPMWRSVLSFVITWGVDLPFVTPRICWCSKCNAEWKL